MPHLTAGELAGYLDQDLSAAERRRVAEHLDACDACRDEAIETARLIGQDLTQASTVRDRGRRWRWAFPAGIAGVAAAAALGAVLLARPDVISWDRETERERFVADGVVPLAVYAPGAGVIRREQLRFVWADAGTGSYRIILTAEDGRPVWSQSLVDTTVMPPPALELEPGERFFWYVDAVGAGVVARTRAHSFVVAP